MATSFSYKEHLLILNQFLGKSDGKDKLCATIQYICLFVCAGKPGNVKKIQASVSAARKVFRILKPLETLTPLILKPGFDASSPRLAQILSKIKSLCMAGYVAFDHVAWMGQAGLVTNTSLLKTFQKASLYSWFIGSLCSICYQYFVVRELLTELRSNPSEGELPSRKAVIRKQLHQQVLALIHASLQGALAMGLLEIAPIGARSVGLIGTLTSALNCYMLFPTLAPQEKEKKS